ncbi:ThiF family adenylyltransferase [Parafilimonas sp.]|uniref:ThiF family adenylyltransferase n=1 Tax=Parafilimonas sp. TaxID=1969739 RepID=UPI0039E6BF85
MKIYPQYPFQAHDFETIRFINKNLLEYGHVNEDGSICVHTLHHPKLTQKLALDLNGLKHWIIKYYIKQEADGAYEHIVVSDTAIDGRKSVFLFTDVNYKFKNQSYGKFTFSILNHGYWRETDYTTLLVRKFKINKEEVACNWGDIYCQNEEIEGLFYFSDKPPVEYKRFTIKSFDKLESYFSQSFLRFLDMFSKQFRGTCYIDHLPLLVGYPVNEVEIHWQVMLIPLDNFPNYGKKIAGTNTWVSMLRKQPIIWGQTRNSSYKYFFGRGAFHPTITSAKILIIGIGAIGSMIATTLTRCGATDILLVDYDVKEPENICRSEYSFFPGITAKVTELASRLVSISPFVNVASSQTLTDFFKIVIQGAENGWRPAIKDRLDEFDIIIDCSTDNDIAFLLDSLGVRGDIYSLSITNHASELICATKHNLYDWLQNIFHQLKREDDDMYNPTGCWSPTFKASYNDISVLVQFALRHINDCYKKNLPVRHFYLTTEDKDCFEIKLNQF